MNNSPCDNFHSANDFCQGCGFLKELHRKDSPCCEKCEGLDRGSGYDGYQSICENPACPCHSNSRGKGGIGTINEDVLDTVGGVGVLPSQEKQHSEVCSFKSNEAPCTCPVRQPSIEDYKCIEHKGQFGNAYLDCEFCKRTPPSEAWGGVAFFLAKEYAKMYYLVSEESWPAHKESDALKNLISFIRQTLKRQETELKLKYGWREN